MRHETAKRFVVGIVSAAMILTNVPVSVIAAETVYETAEEIISEAGMEEDLSSAQEEITLMAAEEAAAAETAAFDEQTSDSTSEAGAEETAEAQDFAEAEEAEEFYPADPEDDFEFGEYAAESQEEIGIDELQVDEDAAEITEGDFDEWESFEVTNDLTEEEEQPEIQEGEKFLAAEADTGMVTLYISNTENVLVNEDVRITVAPVNPEDEIKAIKIHDGGGWWELGNEITRREYDYKFDGDGNFDTMHHWGEEGDMSFYAMVTFDDFEDGNWDEEGNDLRTWYQTEEIVVHVIKEGDVGDFTFSLDQTSVRRGEMIAVSFEEAENADHYWVDIEWQDRSEEDPENRWKWFDHRADTYTAKTAYFSTADMEPGTYHARVGADGQGYQGLYGNGGEWVEFTVEESDIQEGEISLLLGTDHVNTGEEFEYSVYAPGADWIKVYFDWPDNDWWYNDSEGRDFISGRHSYGHSGTWQLHAEAHYSGDEEDAEEIIREADAFVEVDAPSGSLSIRAPEGLPAYLERVDDLDFTAYKPENVANYQVSVWFDPYDEDSGDIFFIDERRDEDYYDVHIPAEKFSAVEQGNTVRVRVYASAPGYDDAEFYTEIPVIEPAEDRAVLTVSKNEALVNEDIRVTVKPVQDGDVIRAMRMWDDGGYWEWGQEFSPDDHSDWFDRNGNFDRGHSWWSEGEKVIFAEVTFDEWDDEAEGGDGGRFWYTTPAEVVSVTANGNIGTFTAEPDKEAYIRGEMVSVTYTEAENADHYWTDIEYWHTAEEDDPTEDWYWFDSGANIEAAIDEAGTASFSTADMEPGRYRMLGQAAGTGYQGRGAENGFIEFEVTDSGLEQDSIVFNVDKTELDTSEPYNFSVYAPGAQWLEVFFDYEHGEDWREEFGGESCNGEHSYGHSGIYQIVARAHYYEADEDGEPVNRDENGAPTDEWTVESEPVTITVTAPNGPLSVRLPDTLPAALTTEDELTFTVEKPAEAEELQVEIWCDTEDGRDRINLTDQWSEEDEVTVTVTTDQLRELGENQKIKLRAYAWAEGYDDAEDYREIPLVAPAATDRVQISISATEVLVNEEVRIKVSPVNVEDTIKAVRFNDGYGFWDERRESRPEQDGDRFDRDGYFNVGQRWGSTGVFSVYAMVTFDDFGDDDYDEDGNDRRTWYTTETLPITVTKTGDLESPVFTLNKTRLGVDDMQNGIGTLTTVDHAESYWMKIERWFDEGETEGDFVCEEAGWYYHMSLALEPSELPEVHIHYADSFVNGTYRIMAGVDGEPGYMGCEANEGRAVVFAFRDPYLTEEEEAAAEELKAAADNLSENAGIPDEENVYALKETLDYLTDGQKAWLGGDEAVADIAGKINQAKEKVDQAKADAAAAAISALPEGAGLGEESSIQAARAAYDDLKPDQQAKIDANTVKKLTDAENKMQSEITAAEKVKSDIEALVNAGADDVEAAAAAQTALSALTPAQQAYLDGKYGEGTAQILSQKAAQAKEKAEAAKAEKAAAEKAADKAAAEEAARIAAAKAAFRLNVKANATVPVQLKKNVKKVKAVLGEGDAIASVTSSNAKFVKAGFSGTTITLKGLKNKKKAVITVTTKYGAQISFKVKVQKKAVKTKSIKVKKKFTVKVGETLDLGVLISPVTTLDKLTFKTSAKKAAAVSKAGIITAKKAGTAKITIKSGKKKKTVTVKITK